MSSPKVKPLELEDMSGLGIAFYHRTDFGGGGLAIETKDGRRTLSFEQARELRDWIELEFLGKANE